MAVSKLTYNSIVYYALHAEQCMAGIITTESQTNIYDEILTISTINYVIEDITSSIEKNKPTQTFETIVFDFNYIRSCQNNTIEKFSSLFELFKDIYFINIHEDIMKSTEMSLLKKNESIKNDSTFSILKITKGTIDIKIESLNDLWTNHFSNVIKSLIDEESEDNTPYLHHSSSVYLSKFIKLKKIITTDSNTILFATYKLAQKIKAKWLNNYQNLDQEAKPVLVCQTLNSSYFASLLSNILCLDLLILDKVGPINKQSSMLDRKIEENRKYIVISDIVCIGTEIRIAKSIIQFLGGNYVGNASIIRIETLKNEDRIFSNYESVISIDTQNAKELNYNILTALNMS